MDPLSLSNSLSSSSSSSSAHITFADQPTSSSSSNDNNNNINSSGQDLIDYGQTEGKDKANDQETEDSEEMDYGSTSNSSKSKSPGVINLPPSPYRQSASISENALSDADGDTSLNSPSLRPIGGGSTSRAPILSPNHTGLSNNNNPNNRQRGFSFKRSNRPGSSGANSNQTPNFLKRASIAIGGGGRDRDGRKSFGSINGDGNAQSRWKNFRRFKTASITGGGGNGSGYGPRINDDEDPFSEEIEEVKPHVPSLIPQKNTSSTPIPTLPFVVLCLMIFGEFSSAGVAGPFLFFMIEDFKVGGEADVGFWAGIVSAVFFFAQFLTSLLWASVAEKHGRKKVLLVSLVGNAITLVLFGTSTSLKMAITVRLAQGLFNGAVGVAKGAVRDLTDETNEGRAYALMGFCWGMGGLVGPIAGGIFEHPATKFPSIFGKTQLFIDFPYLLPCIIGASFTALGAFLSLFLGEDGGLKSGSISLPETIDVERATHRAATNVGSLGRSARKRISGYFSSTSGGGNNEELSESGVSLEQTSRRDETGKGLPRTFTQQVDFDTGGPASRPPSPAESDDDDEGTVITRTEAMNSGFDRRSLMSGKFSRTSARHRNILGGGSAYGYDESSIRIPALENPNDNRSGISRYNTRSTVNQTGERNTINRNSFISNNQYAPDFEELGNKQPLSFAQRFLLANDDAVLSLTDLWVAAAINGDENYDAIDEDEFIDDDDEFQENDDDLDESLDGRGSTSIEDDDEDDDDELANISNRDKLSESTSLLKQPKHLAPLNFAKRKLSRGAYTTNSSSDAGSSGYASRPRFGRKTSGGNRIPSLYNNTGVERPLSPGPLSPNLNGFQNQQQQNSRSENIGYDPTLAGIPESHSARNSLYGTTKTLPSKNLNGIQNEIIEENSNSQFTANDNKNSATQPSIFSLLPLVIIGQYGLMSLHSSTFEQVFMAFLVTPFSSGGLGLSSQHYAELIAAMAVCQLVFQFYYYPWLGPPLGKFSHLAMMRIGLAMYLPAYALFPYLRNFLHPSTDATVMAGMILFAAFRWLANVTAFTAVTVLMNAMTPPHLVPLANGLAQTTSSAARFIGPIIGGIVWMRSVEGGPNAHSFPFNYHEGFLMVGMLGFIGFLHSWTIK